MVTEIVFVCFIPLLIISDCGFVLVQVLVTLLGFPSRENHTSVLIADTTSEEDCKPRWKKLTE